MARPKKEVGSEKATISSLLNGQEDVFTIEEIAEACRVTEVTVRRWIAAGDLEAVKFGGTTRIYRESFLKLLNEPSNDNVWVYLDPQDEDAFERLGVGYVRISRKVFENYVAYVQNRWIEEDINSRDTDSLAHTEEERRILAAQIAETEAARFNFMQHYYEYLRTSKPSPDKKS